MNQYARPGRMGWAAGIVLTLTIAAGAAEPQTDISPEAQALLPGLDAPDDFTRQATFLQLEALRDPSTASIIRNYIDNPDPDTRAYSLRALAAIARADAVPLLVDRARSDRVPRVRIAALLALEPLRDPAATQVILSALRDRHPQVRMAAIDVASRLEQPEARAAIQQRARRERDRDVRRVLEMAVERLSDAAPSASTAP
jgi:HEAT repeat protein